MHWTIDYARFEEKSKNYPMHVEAENTATVDQARADFREKNAMIRERILWDWCPFWRVLEANKGIFDRLPPLPWSHDSKSTNLLTIEAFTSFRMVRILKNILS